MRVLSILTIVFAAMVPARAELPRVPSCNVLIAMVDSARLYLIENTFGRRFDEMSSQDFDEVVEIVSNCIDRSAARGPDRPGLFRWEQRSTQLNVLSILLEEVQMQRGRQRERERDLRAGK